jgi:hypothetical protein
VYFEGVRFDVRDPATFTLLDYGFAKDRLTGYYHQAVVPGSDGSTLTFVDSHYSKDATHVFYSRIAPRTNEGTSVRRTRLVDGAHVGTFTALEYDYAADSAQVYYEGKPLTRDPQSFRVLQIGYAVSKDRVYYFGAAIADGDASTFTVLDALTDSVDARDARATYQQGRRTIAPAGK